LVARAMRRHEKSAVKYLEGASTLYLAREEAQFEAESMTKKPSRYNVPSRRAPVKQAGAEAREAAMRAAKSEYNRLCERLAQN
jgi:hypothetical protein